MPRKKIEFKTLTSKGVVKVNPERKNLSGSKTSFFSLLTKALKVEPFDKKKRD